MNLNSFAYLLFVPLTFIIFYLTSSRYRWAVLLISSLLFYAALKIPYLFIPLAFVTLVSFYFARWLASAKNEKQKQQILTAGIILNLLPLFFLRYLPALIQQLQTILSFPLNGIATSLLQNLAAVGVSFYSFQAISYLVDVYLEVIEPETHFGIFALYLGFFPKLLQGPIERGADLLPQLHKSYSFDYSNTRVGLLLIAWGLFKKFVLAARLGMFVDAVYNNVSVYSGFSLILATYLYAFQIYYDFSAYTDIALGTAKLFNINLTQNFNRPYLATSIADFWRRWHISFSRWILDYIFKPLQLYWRSWKTWGTAAALLVTFLVSGVWHGASWTFVIWGLLFGIYLAVEVLTAPFEKKLVKKFNLGKSRVWKGWKIFSTFNLVCFAWIFFRSNNLSDAAYVVSHLFNFSAQSKLLFSLKMSSYSWNNPFNLNFFLGPNGPNIIILMGALLLMAAISILNARLSNLLFQAFSKQKTIIRWAAYYLFIILTLVYGIFETRQFIYNRF